MNSSFILSLGWSSSFTNISVCLNNHGNKAFLLKTTVKIYLHFHMEHDKYHCSLKTLKLN